MGRIGPYHQSFIRGPQFYQDWGLHQCAKWVNTTQKQKIILFFERERGEEWGRAWQWRRRAEAHSPPPSHRSASGPESSDAHHHHLLLLFPPCLVPNSHYTHSVSFFFSFNYDSWVKFCWLLVCVFGNYEMGCSYFDFPPFFFQVCCILMNQEKTHQEWKIQCTKNENRAWVKLEALHPIGLRSSVGDHYFDLRRSKLQKPKFVNR